MRELRRAQKGNSFYNVLNTVAEVVSLTREIARSEVRVVADLYHMAGNDEPPEAVEQAVD